MLSKKLYQNTVRNLQIHHNSPVFRLMFRCQMTINKWPGKCFGFTGNKVILIYCIGENIKIVVQMDSTLRHVTLPHDQVFAIITGSRIRHKLPKNSHKAFANKSVQKLLKSSCFIFEVAEKLPIFEKVAEQLLLLYLFALEVGFIAVFTRRIRLYFSFSSYLSFFRGSEICLLPFSYLKRVNRAFISDSVVRHLENESCDSADLVDRRATPSWNW